MKKPHTPNLIRQLENKKCINVEWGEGGGESFRSRKGKKEFQAFTLTQILLQHHKHKNYIVFLVGAEEKWHQNEWYTYTSLSPYLSVEQTTVEFFFSVWICTHDSTKCLKLFATISIAGRWKQSHLFSNCNANTNDGCLKRRASVNWVWYRVFFSHSV